MSATAGFEGYAAWRQSRMALRSDARWRMPGAWNHLITVIAFGDTAAALAATLDSLRAQSYRNIEILVAGHAAATLPHAGDFATLRGLFAEPALDPIDILADPRSESLWRGNHLVFARAGTLFDPDTFALLNSSLRPTSCGAPPDLVVCDHDRATEAGPAPCFLPGWDPDLVRAMDVIGTAFMVSRRLVRAGSNAERPRSLHEWLCRLATRKEAPVWTHLAEPVIHLPDPMPQLGAALSAPAIAAAAPSVAIVIPNRDRPDLLARCVEFLSTLDLPAPELVIVDHASSDPATLALYASLRHRYGARILPVAGRFNFSHMVNLGVTATTAEVAVLLNNDVEVTRPGQVETLVAHAARPEVGVAGARLLYPDGRVQHAGVLLQAGPDADNSVAAMHVLRGEPDAADGYLHALRTVRNYQAVTGALMATRRAVFDAVGGFDEVSLPVEYNDVDYCLKARALDLRVLVVPTEGVLHHESATRLTQMTPEVLRMRQAAMALIRLRWPKEVRHDPFRNPWVTLGDVPQARFPWTGAAGA